MLQTRLLPSLLPSPSFSPSIFCTPLYPPTLFIRHLNSASASSILPKSHPNMMQSQAPKDRRTTLDNPDPTLFDLPRRSSLAVPTDKMVRLHRSSTTAANYRPFASKLYSSPRPFVLDDSDAEEAWLELFFDLVFVAACLKLGGVIKHCSRGWAEPGEYHSYGHGFAVFSVFWLSWLHFTAYLNRFYTEDLVHKALFLVFQLGLVGMVLNTNKTESEEGGYQECEAEAAFSKGFAGAFAVTRALLIALYGAVILALPSTAEQFGPQIAGWTLSIVVSGALAAANAGGAWQNWALFGVVFVEGGTFVWATHRSVVKFNIEHFDSRTGSFIMIMLGEGVIQLLIPNISDDSDLGDHYIFALVGFTFLFAVALQYFDSEPDYWAHVLMVSPGRSRAWIFMHCGLSYSLLLVGVALKSIAYHVELSEADKDENVLLSVGCCLTVISITAIRFLHKGVRNISERRFLTYLTRLAVGVTHGLVHYAFSDVMAVLSSHLALAIFMVAIDIMSRRRKEAKSRHEGDTDQQDPTDKSVRILGETGHHKHNELAKRSSMI